MTNKIEKPNDVISPEPAMAPRAERPRFVNEAIALVIGALLATGVSLTQTWMQWRTEEYRTQREGETRLMENRRIVYEQFLRAADDYRRTALANPNFFKVSGVDAGSLKVDPDYKRVSEELAASADRLSLVAGPQVLNTGRVFHGDIERAFTQGRVPENYDEERQRFIDAARAELGIPSRR